MPWGTNTPYTYSRQGTGLVWVTPLDGSVGEPHTREGIKERAFPPLFVEG